MINKGDIEKLAVLARIKLTEGEALRYAGQAESIIEYIGQINSALSDISIEEKIVGFPRNVFREDEVLNKTGEYTDSLLSNSPDRDSNFIKVKKIL